MTHSRMPEYYSSSPRVASMNSLLRSPFPLLRARLYTPDDGIRADEVLNIADERMYSKKRQEDS
ncbi:hypothetical protein KKHLCK_05800 [Candidatus Electrothrix laxa]